MPDGSGTNVEPTAEQRAWVLLFTGIDMRTEGAAPGAPAGDAPGGPPPGGPPEPNKQVASRAGGGKSPARAKGHAPDAAAKERGILRTEIVNRGLINLDQQTVQLGKVVQNFYDRNYNAIDHLKDQAPKGSGLFKALAAGFKVVCAVAFPEVVLLEVAGKVVETAAKGEEMFNKMQEKEDEARKTSLEEGKKRALQELLDLKKGTEAAITAATEKFTATLNAAVDKLKPADFAALEGDNMSHNIDGFLKDTLKITRGSDTDPAVFTKLDKDLQSRFDGWMKQDFRDHKFEEKAYAVLIKMENDNLQGPFLGDAQERQMKKKLADPKFVEEVNRQLDADYDKEIGNQLKSTP
jgi:hypothetical protein